MYNVRLVLLTKEILFVCITLRVTQRPIRIALCNMLVGLCIVYVNPTRGVANKRVYYIIIPHVGIGFFNVLAVVLSDTVSRKRYYYYDVIYHD